jgi:carbon starvation protein
MLLLLFALAGLAFVVAYLVYGRYLSRSFGLDDARPTPSHADYDGIDRVPAHRVVLLGHHFSSIAGAGPIVGPIIAATVFGWLPTLLWIVLGSILIGGVHDFSALVASIRHRARSIAEIAREYMTPLAYRLMLGFIWLGLIYVLVVFIDLTAISFTTNGGVATSCLIYIALAIGFGLSIYRWKLSVLQGSLIFVPLVFLSVWLGQLAPMPTDRLPALLGSPVKTWDILLVLYCFIASTTPVWILLQPRDYLSSYLLYASVLAGVLGIAFGGFAVQYPAFKGWYGPELGALFPILFITVACGACSGFHSVIASGTTSKQIDRESDARVVGYGGMLIEGLVAVIALATVVMLAQSDPTSAKQPLAIYGAGVGRFLALFGIPAKIGSSFGLLAISTFILTTLDTCTRLGRYVFEEFFSVKGRSQRYVATLATLVLPTVFVLLQLKDAQGNPMPAWRAIWPVFGATNQLLGALALIVISVWLLKTGRKIRFLVLPTVFMVVMTLWALALLIGKYRFSVIGLIAIALLLLAVLMLWEAGRIFRRLIAERAVRARAA